MREHGFAQLGNEESEPVSNITIRSEKKRALLFQ
jgi:hypothetical protein